MHIINKNSVWDFKFPKATRVPCSVKLAIPKPT